MNAGLHRIHTSRSRPARAWAALLDVERWWPPSNPEHESIQRLEEAAKTTDTCCGSGTEIGVGTRFRIREKIAGVPGEGVGVVTCVEPGTAITWEAEKMSYRLYGMSFLIGEGVTWRVDHDAPGTSLISARVWARFPTGVRGRILWLVFARVLHGIEKDRHHACVELAYLKEMIESAPAP